MSFELDENKIEEESNNILLNAKSDKTLPIFALSHMGQNNTSGAFGGKIETAIQHPTVMGMSIGVATALIVILIIVIVILSILALLFFIFWGTGCCEAGFFY